MFCYLYFAAAIAAKNMVPRSLEASEAQLLSRDQGCVSSRFDQAIALKFAFTSFAERLQNGQIVCHVRVSVASLVPIFQTSRTEHHMY